METISNMVPSDKKNNEGVNLDRILVEEIGQFGKYQLKVILFCAAVHLFTGFSECEYLYTAANVNYRCTIPECENEEMFSPRWILNAIPPSGDTFDSCRRFANSSVSRNVTMDFTCPQHMFDRGNIIECQDYIYEHQNSAVYEFDLACDERRRVLVGFASVLGMMLGLPITGYFSDRYGRRITISSFNYAWIGVVKYWANCYETFIVGIFVEHLLGACSFSCAFILALELVGPKQRAAVGSLMRTCLALGTALQGLVIWTQPYWRHFILIVNVPQLVAIFYFWASPESVRWLISKGRFKEAKSALMVVAETNGKELSEKTFESFKEEENKISEYADTESEPWLISLVFQHNSMILRCLVTPVWWISALLIHFGLTITSVDINGNKNLSYVTVNALEIPGYWAGYWLMNKFGRKPLIIGAFWICGVCQIAYIFIPNGYYPVSLTVYLFGKFCISAVVSAIYIYSSELYPTRYRTSLLCFSSMIGRLGVLVAQLTPAMSSSIWRHLPFVLFGGMAFLSGLLVILAPETLGSALPDTMEEAANLGKNRSKNQSVIKFAIKKKSYHVN